MISNLEGWLSISHF
ncbi:hypothetical protein CAEBREN_22124 [Caenorhabditis brenneri]|uniref:Uncharacterized protein n=1 Tax=Caenorhabditis brenneri TaxID=135651 RepID=G0M872_CAEBE|nr:hypothetical protein CAEBREN_22124 [Caenorhabditis brenneri]